MAPMVWGWSRRMMFAMSCGRVVMGSRVWVSTKARSQLAIGYWQLRVWVMSG